MASHFQSGGFLWPSPALMVTVSKKLVETLFMSTPKYIEKLQAVQ